MYPEQWLEKASSGEKIAADIRLKIIEGTYPAGSKLTENQLAKKYDTSRSPIRDAIKILSSERLITTERMGIVVVGLNDSDIEEIYDIRLLIESFVFERLTNASAPDVIRQLSKILEMMKVAVKFQDADEFSYQDIMFHQTFIMSINHKQIAYQWYNLKPIMEALILISMRNRMDDQEEDFERVLNNHELYIRAIQEKDRSLFKEALHVNFDDVDDQVEALWHSQHRKDD